MQHANIASRDSHPARQRGSARLLLLLALLAVGVALWFWKRSEPGLGMSHDAAMHAHPDDPDKGKEHMALLDLLPGEHLATHVAANDGAWSDPATWKAAELPGAGALVLIPAARKLTYSGKSAQGLFIVRVEGSLRIEAGPGVETQMVVDTLFSTPDSELFIEATGATAGSIEIKIQPFDIEAHKKNGAPGWNSSAKDYYSDGAPVTWTKAATVASADSPQLFDGPGVLGRYGWDPEQLSIGVIVHGSARFAGKPMLSKSIIERIAMAGDTSVLLKAQPEGWKAGDKIVITGTHYVGRDLVTGAYAGTQDELRTISAIVGREVSFEAALEHDHDTPQSDLYSYAANLTRNVHFQSSAASNLEHLNDLEVDAVASNLGHVMFMHNDDVSVRFTSFDALGRTNKVHVADDFRRTGGGLDGGRQHPAGAPQTVMIKTKVHQVRNPRGRYSVHMHRTGARDGSRTGLIEGSVVTGGPGWGFVSHDSSADFLNNVAYGVLGAAFVAETGNETGEWTGNIAINTYGTSYNSKLLDPTGLFQYENDIFARIVTLEKRGSWKNHDFGHLGDGFWFQGKLIDIRNNVSVNSGLFGYFFMFRAPDQIKVDRNVLEEPLTVHSPSGIHPIAPGLNVFEGNRSIADRGGLIMIGIGGGRTNDERSVVRDFTAWEVGEEGTHAQYYPGYTIRDSSFLGSSSPDANPRKGVLLEKVQLDTVLANLTVEGFTHQYELHKSWSPGARGQQGLLGPYEVIQAAVAEGVPNPLPLGYAHILIDPGFTREQAAEVEHCGRTYRPEDIIMRSDELVLGRLEVKFEDDSLRIDLDNRFLEYGPLRPDPIRPTLQRGHVLLLRGTKTDSIGSVPIEYHNNVLVWHPDAVQDRLTTQGYFEMPSGSLGVMLEEVFADRYTAERKVVRFMAELDKRWDMQGAINLGAYETGEHPEVYVPAFLMAP